MTGLLVGLDGRASNCLASHGHDGFGLRARYSHFLGGCSGSCMGRRRLTEHVGYNARIYAVNMVFVVYKTLVYRGVRLRCST